MTIEEVIKKAVEGGWKPKMDEKFKKKFEVEHDNVIFYSKVNVRRYPLDSIFIDPKFWQALGKYMGWEPQSFLMCGNADCPNQDKSKEFKCCSECGCGFETYYNGKLDWKQYWHKFIDHLAEGKTAEDYFKTLI